MTQLTKEFFEEKLNGLVTDETLDKKLKHLDDRITSRFSDQTQQLREFTLAQVQLVRTELHGLEQRVNIKLDAMLELLDVRKDVEKLKLDVQKLMSERQHQIVN